VSSVIVNNIILIGKNILFRWGGQSPPRTLLVATANSKETSIISKTHCPAEWNLFGFALDIYVEPTRSRTKRDDERAQQNRYRTPPPPSRLVQPVRVVFRYARALERRRSQEHRAVVAAPDGGRPQPNNAAPAFRPPTATGRLHRFARRRAVVTAVVVRRRCTHTLARITTPSSSPSPSAVARPRSSRHAEY